jgi:Tfp pilus assembly protein PilZ
MPRNDTDSSRLFRRQTVRILVDYLGKNGVCCEYATTLGAGDLLIETEKTFTADTQLKLHFRLGGEGETHEIEGRVVWVRKTDVGGRLHAPGMGIQFTNSVGASALARELEDFEG